MVSGNIYASLGYYMRVMDITAFVVVLVQRFILSHFTFNHPEQFKRADISCRCNKKKRNSTRNSAYNVAFG